METFSRELFFTLKRYDNTHEQDILLFYRGAQHSTPHHVTKDIENRLYSRESGETGL